MKDLQQPFETSGHDLSGFASAQLHHSNGFNELASQLADYNLQRFTPVALKVFFEQNDLIVTLYALDKDALGHSDIPEGKYPVRKFKLHPPFEALMKHIKSIDMVLTDGSHTIENMVVMNQ